MRKALLVSAVALAMAGCAAQQQPSSQVTVRDLSVAREATTPASYTVEAGDTLYGIAWRHDMDYRELARLNQIGPPYLLQPGQQLRLGGDGTGRALAGGPGEPRPSGVQVTPLGEAPADGDLDWLTPEAPARESGQRLSVTPLEGEAVAAAGQVAEAETVAPGPVLSPDSPGADGRLSERDLAERQAQETAPREPAVESPRPASRDTEAPTVADTESSSPAADTAPQESAAAPAEEAAPASRNGQRTYTPVAEVPWQWPADGELVGAFGDGGNITAGIDIAGQKGQPVRAAGPGIVVYAGSGVRGYGNLILLKHNDEYLSAYAHNESLRVSENDVVEAGEVIATMGDTDADQVKLHFEVRRNGQPQDPLTYLPSR